MEVAIQVTVLGEVLANCQKQAISYAKGNAPQLTCQAIRSAADAHHARVEHGAKVDLWFFDEKAWTKDYQFREFYVTRSTNIEDLNDVTIKLGFQVFMSVANVDTGDLESIEMMRFYLTTDDTIQAVFSVDNKFSLFYTSANTRVGDLLPF